MSTVLLVNKTNKRNRPYTKTKNGHWSKNFSTIFIRRSIMSIPTFIVLIHLENALLGLPVCLWPWYGVFIILLWLLHLYITKFLNQCPTYHMLRLLLMSHKKCPMSEIFLVSTDGIFLLFFHIVLKSFNCTNFWTIMSDMSHLNCPLLA